MPVIESSVVVPVAPDVAFAVSQTTGDLRLRWDPFIGGQHSWTAPSGRTSACERSPGTASDPRW